MNWHDGEQIIREHKEFSRKISKSRHGAAENGRSSQQPALYLRVLAQIGAAMVFVGLRLQLGYQQVIATTRELDEHSAISAVSSKRRTSSMDAL